MKKINLHTHTNLCDGKNTAEEMVISAIDSGFDLLGFSGHSYTPFDESYCMSLEKTRIYKEEISRLALKYKSEISILCGIEQDYYSNQPTDDYSYVIGSVHAFYNEKFNEYIYVDYTQDTLIKAIDDFYHGDPLSLAEDYFERVCDVFNKTRCNIIGHFDLLTKFNENIKMFDENNPRYQLAVDKSLAVLLQSGAIFEINTGAMSKGYRSVPYPSESILRKIKKGGGKIILSSDTHSIDTLDFAFDDAKKLAKLCGFDSIMLCNSLGQFYETQL